MRLSERWDGRSPDEETALRPDDISRIQDEAIAAAVEYAWRNSPFYRRRFDAAGLRPSDVTSAAQLERVPLTSKRDISEAGRELWCVPDEKIVDIVTTSGTTGVPTLYPMTEADLRRLGYNEHLSFHCAGLTSSDTAILAVTMDKCFMAGLAYFEGLRRIGAATIRVGSGSVVMLLSLMERLRPTVVVSVPSFLRKVADYAAQRGLDPPFGASFDLAGGPVKKLVCIGEPLRGEDFELNPLGRRISDAWGARVYSTYGVTEIATSLCECDAGRGGHLHPELLRLEIVDDDGRRVRDGQPGEIVATTLGVEAMPLLRFRTGDCSFMISERCSCGRWTPRVGPILGRKNQAMKLKGTTVYPAAVQKALDGIAEVGDYVMIVTSETPLSDELEIVIALGKSVTGTRPDGACHTFSPVERIREQLQGELKVTPTVRLASAEEVERLQNMDAYRKKRVFIDRREG